MPAIFQPILRAKSPCSKARVNGSCSPRTCTRIENSLFSARLNFLSVLRDTGWRDLEFWLLDLAAAFSAIITLPV